MAYYYKSHDLDPGDSCSGLNCETFQVSGHSFPKNSFDFSKHILIELLENTIPEEELWKKLELSSNVNIVHKRMMVDSHRIQCRRAVVIFNESSEAKVQAERLSQVKVGAQKICATTVDELLFDLRLFEKQIMQFGDKMPQSQLLYVSDLKNYQKSSDLLQFLKETFSSFGTILSVFTCPDNGHVQPEGVIKFAYLSEAFAAELALDQCVVGNVTLSVTCHHNILLSQCDLRLRLRNAQYANFFEGNTLTECSEPFYNNHNFKYGLEDSLVNNFLDCQISCEEKKDKTKYSNKSETCNTTLNILPVKYKDSSELFELVSTDCDNNTDFEANMSSLSALNSSDNAPFQKKTTEKKTQASKFIQNFNHAVSKTSLSTPKLDVDTNLKMLTKHPTKRKKRFMPSQKLCLKSQRMALSQRSSVQDSVSNCHSSPEGKSKESSLAPFKSVPETSGSSKVHKWLLKLPNSNTMPTDNMKTEILDDSHLNSHSCLHRISLHTTPALRHKKKFNAKNIKILNFSKNNVENADPNVSATKLNSKNTASEYTKSLLKDWLRQELLFSTNNTVTTCKNISQSIIVCATKTKDKAISVGCSHILCDKCYPDSTNLLLGYC